MAATQYHLYTRYVNENTHIAITNKSIDEYVPLRELYSDDHQLYSDDASVEEKQEAYLGKEQILLNSMNVNNPKHDMLFYYTGTKRIYRKRFVPASVGYVINYDRINEIPKDKITYNGDYSGTYTEIDGEIVTKKCPIEKEYINNLDINESYLNARNDYGDKAILKTPGASLSEEKQVNAKEFNIIETNQKKSANGMYFTKQEAYDICQKNTIAQLKSFEDVKLGDMSVYNYYEWPTPGGSGSTTRIASDLNICIVDEENGGTNTLDQVQPLYSAGRTTTVSAKCSKGCNYDTFARPVYSEESVMSCGLAVTKSLIKKKTIPAHMEDVEDNTDYPYMVMDTYDRAKGDPWFLFEVFDSLNSAINRTREVVKKIGIKNVKLVKNVPIDQDIKII